MDAQTALLLLLAVVALAVIASRLRPSANAGDQSADAALTAAVNAAISAALAREFPFATVPFSVKTFGGVVILGGIAREYEHMKRAVEVAGGVAGVKSVDNRMSVVSGG